MSRHSERMERLVGLNLWQQQQQGFQSSVSHKWRVPIPPVEPQSEPLISKNERSREVLSS